MLTRIKNVLGKLRSGEEQPISDGTTTQVPPLPKFPGYICLELTNACNLRCDQCLYRGTTTDGYVGKSGMIDVELAKKVLRELGLRKCSVMLNGDGESLLHPRFLEVAEFAMSQDLPSVYFNTNANKLDKSMTNELVRFFKGDIQISLDGFKDSHERIRVGSNYDQTIENLEYLRQRIRETGAPITITVNYCKYDQPKEELGEFVQYWIERVNSVSAGVVWDKDYRLMSGAEEGFDPVKRILCVIPWQTLIVRWNGKVIPCSNCFTKGYDGYFIIGDANHQTVEEIWAGEPYQRWRKKLENWNFAETVCEICDRWKMTVVFDDQIQDGMLIKRTGAFTTYSKLP